MPYVMMMGSTLSTTLRGTAHTLLLEPNSSGRWDQRAEFRPESNIGANDIFAIQLTAGSTIDVYAENLYSQAGGLVLYDQDGNSIARGWDSHTFADQLSDFVAPYTGLYYINALWNPNSTPGSAHVRVQVDLPSPATEGDDELGGRYVIAGGGNDTVLGTIADDYQRGGDGDDRLLGEYGFDDLHGNKGDDTIFGGHGYDWVVGGQGNDLLHGDGPTSSGYTGDQILGNMGDDTLIGSIGPDVLRGGQANDHLQGWQGADFLSGDRGDDTLWGGEGADIFHTFVGAGIDRVMDFSVTDGDRIKFEVGGTPHTIRQVGADTVIEIDGAQVILVGVTASTLPAGWLTPG